MFIRTDLQSLSLSLQFFLLLFQASVCVRALVTVQVVCAVFNMSSSLPHTHPFDLQAVACNVSHIAPPRRSPKYPVGDV